MLVVVLFMGAILTFILTVVLFVAATPTFILTWRLHQFVDAILTFYCGAAAA